MSHSAFARRAFSKKVPEGHDLLEADWETWKAGPRRHHDEGCCLFYSALAAVVASTCADEPAKWERAFGTALGVAVSRNISKTMHAQQSNLNRSHAALVWLAANLVADLVAFIMKKNDPRPVAVVGIYLDDKGAKQYALLGTNAQRPSSESESACVYIFIRFPDDLDDDDRAVVGFRGIKPRNVGYGSSSSPSSSMPGTFETQLSLFRPPHITINNYGPDKAAEAGADGRNVSTSARQQQQKGRGGGVRGLFCCLVRCSLLQFWWVAMLAAFVAAAAMSIHSLGRNLSTALTAFSSPLWGVAALPGFGWAAVAQELPPRPAPEMTRASSMYSVPHVSRDSLPAVASFADTTLQKARLSLDKVRLEHKDYVDASLSLQAIFDELESFKTFRTGPVTLEQVLDMFERRHGEIMRQFWDLVRIEKDLESWNSSSSRGGEQEESSLSDKILSLLSYQKIQAAKAHTRLQTISQQLLGEISTAIRNLDQARITFTDLFYLFKDMYRDLVEQYRPKVASAADDFKSSAERLEKAHVTKLAAAAKKAQDGRKAAKEASRKSWFRMTKRNKLEKDGSASNDSSGGSDPQAPNLQELEDRLRAGSSPDRLRKGEQSLRDVDATLSLVAFFTKKTSLTISLTSQTYERERAELLQLERAAKHIRDFLADRNREYDMDQLDGYRAELENLRRDMWECVSRYHVVQNE